jgi:hypothetical protein
MKVIIPKAVKWCPECGSIYVSVCSAADQKSEVYSPLRLENQDGWFMAKDASIKYFKTKNSCNGQFCEHL